ncbi:hypothetical protein LOD99_3280 [Oopsacas minuta]|uniref:BZIP domain-containing protein n=1 Tax=Oopsacas minuta TaxID=111878 RepID=A0AAV7JYL8_9METZ|nr:hypothetical protein LOD99_3280 [Oopsacas minuta]
MMSGREITNLPMSRDLITGLDIKSLNKVIKQKGYSGDDRAVIKQFRRKEKSKQRSQKLDVTIKFLESERETLQHEYNELLQEVDELNVLKVVLVDTYRMYSNNSNRHYQY